MPTKILWTDETWNPVCGCTKVSEGCKNCYAERMARRLACMGQQKYQNVIDGKRWNTAIAYNEKWLKLPKGKGKRIFVCSMGDLFHKLVPFEFIADVLSVLAVCKHHTGQILTKRAERMLEVMTDPRLRKHISKRVLEWDLGYAVVNPECDKGWPLENIWLGVTAENQKCADERTPIIVQIAAAVRFISFEPLLGWIKDVPFTSCREDDTGFDEFGRHIDWAIIGCESINGWAGRFCSEGEFIPAALNLVEQCDSADVPVLVKQIPHNGKVLHARDYIEKGNWPDCWPKKLRRQEYPKGG